MRVLAIAGLAWALMAQVGPDTQGPIKYSRAPDYSNVRYDVPERNVLDLWKAPSDHPTRLVVYFHPGGFNHGDKSWVDAGRSIQFLRLHAKEYNVNPMAIIPSGGSAGGVMGLGIAFHDDLADPNSEDPLKRQSTRVCTSGVVDSQTTLDPRVLVKVVDPKWVSHP